MSRIFELLRQVQRENAIFEPVVAPPTASSRNAEVLRRARKNKDLFENVSAPVSVPSTPAPSRTAEFSSDETFKLVQRVFVAPDAPNPKMLVFCAVDHSGMPNWICARAAELVASHTHQSVCVVDANFASPSLHEYFKIDNRRGLALAAVEPGPVKKFICSIRQNSLWLMPAGPTSSALDLNSVSLSTELRSRIIEMRANFEYVILDAPPAGGGPLTSHLAALADGVIFIIEPGITLRQAAREAKEGIEAAGGKVLGVVLHRRPLLFTDRTGRPQKS